MFADLADELETRSEQEEEMVYTDLTPVAACVGNGMESVKTLENGHVRQGRNCFHATLLDSAEKN